VRTKYVLDENNNVELVAPDEGTYPTDPRPAWELWVNGEYQEGWSPMLLKRELWEQVRRLITLPQSKIPFSLVWEHQRSLKQVVDGLYDQYHGFIP
jgi:hypothetical protein